MLDATLCASYSCATVRHLLALLALAFATFSSTAFAEESFTQGFVTRVSPGGVFDVNGMHVLVDSKTAITVKQWSDARPGAHLISSSATALPSLFLGEPAEVVGSIVHKSTEIRAKSIVISPPPISRVSGVGIIDLIPASSESSEGKLFRADGYTMQNTTKTVATFVAPLSSVADIHANIWVRYQGVQRPDGVVVLDQADFSPNTVNHREDRLRSKSDYDPAAIDQGDAQGGASKFFRGKNPMRLPAWHDDAMQDRVNRIGNSLVPAFQKALAEDDPTRIDFRFQVTDEPKHTDAWSLSSGIILIPHQVVERLPEDSQLAAVLADNIAEVLEKQVLRDVPARQKMTAASYAGSAAGFVIPGAGLATMIANHEVAKSMLSHSRQQSGRVSLCLLHDAGYDIAQSPTAWWTLAAKSKDGKLPTKMPDHTFFLYEDLGANWQNASAGPIP